jgi:two-component system, cell cycle response regulator CpdR
MPKTILLVDDDLLVLHVVATMLEDLGCEVVSETGAEQALDVLRRRPDIAALITDVNMPDVDGYELARAAQEVRPDLKVLMLSARPQEPRGYPLLCKPFREKDLAKVMETTTGRC